MIELCFSFVICIGFFLGLAWLSVYYIIYFKYKADHQFKIAKSKISYIKAQPSTACNLFTAYRYIEKSIYGMLFLACVLLILQFGFKWLDK